MSAHQRTRDTWLRPNPAALADQVVAILRDAAPLPLGTHQIGQRLGPHRWRWMQHDCGHNDCKIPEHSTVRAAPYERDYHPAELFTPQLRRLARQGVVERIPKVSGPRLDAYGQDYWRYLGGDS